MMYADCIDKLSEYSQLHSKVVSFHYITSLKTRNIDALEFEDQGFAEFCSKQINLTTRKQNLNYFYGLYNEPKLEDAYLQLILKNSGFERINVKPSVEY